MDRARGDESGFSMIEILIVVGLLGLLYVILGSYYQGWVEKYRVETTVKEMFADLMDARGRAMQKKRAHFIVPVPPNGYQIVEDTSPAPDGDGVQDPNDTWVRSGTVRYPVTTIPASMTQITFRRDGLLSTNVGDTATLRLTSPVQADYDCINLGPTRVKMGRFDEATNACVER